MQVHPREVGSNEGVALNGDIVTSLTSNSNHHQNSGPSSHLE
jgi:hypothetical protein